MTGISRGIGEAGGYATPMPCYSMEKFSSSLAKVLVCLGTLVLSKEIPKEKRGNNWWKLVLSNEINDLRAILLHVRRLLKLLALPEGE